MVDQDTQAQAPARPADPYADALSELATSISDLASAIRESASFADVEFVPCEDIVEAAERDETSPRDPCSRGTVTMLPVIPAQTRCEPDTGPLCRPGGCGCGEPDTGQGRHARRDATSDETTEQSRPVSSSRTAQVGTR